MRTLLLVALIACGKDAPPAATPSTPTEAAPAPSKPPRAASKIVDETFRSAALGVDKAVKIYLPAGYDPADERRYPVFYYLHGLGGSETDWLRGGKLDQAADQLGLEAIVVMPDGDNNLYIDSALDTRFDACTSTGEGMFDPRQSRTQTCVKASKYETYITQDLIGFVDGKYKTIATREARGIAGLSMGGYGALVLSMRHLELFGAAASHSGLITPLYKGPWPYEKGKVQLFATTEETVAAYKHLGNLGPWVLALYGADLANWRAHDPTLLLDKLKPGSLHLYLDCGTEDEFQFQHSMQYLHDLLLARGIAHEYYLGPGHHSFDFWKARLPISLAFLRDRLAKAR